MISVESLKSHALVKDINAYTVMIKTGEATVDKMYVLLEGRVGVFSDYGVRGEQKLYELVSGDFFNEMKLFMNKNREDTVVSLTDLKVLEITRDNVHQFFAEYPEITYMLIQTFCERAEKANAAAAESEARVAEQEAAPQEKPEVKKPVLKLFPSGHAKYTLPDFTFKKDLVRNETFTCPLCGNKFDFPLIRTVVVRTLSTDYDLRKNYDGVVGTHHLVATCPNCLFSSVTDKWDEAAKGNRAQVFRATVVHKDALGLTFTAMDADTIFARLYLALACAPLCFENHEMITARLWINISWLYRDCGDENMEKYATAQALQAYLTSYTNIKLDKKTEQAVCIIVGELCYKMGDINNAKKFFFSAKTNREGAAVMTNLAEDRLIDIREGERS